MGIFDRFHGHESHHTGDTASRVDNESFGAPPWSGLTERQAIARYRDLLRMAPPETIERAHAVAFAHLTAEQCHQVFAELCHETPAFEWESGRRYSDDARSLARMATRAELEHPGILERAFERIDSAETSPPTAETSGSTFLGRVASDVIGSWAASQFFAETGQAESMPGGTDIDSARDLLIDQQSLPPRAQMNDH